MKLGWLLPLVLGCAPAKDASTVVSTPSTFGAEWLVVKGNRIVYGDGKPFHGRGANLHDERSCSACSYAPPNPNGVDRWADELVDVWKANFVRFLLSSKAAPHNAYERQWKSLVDDPQYVADVKQNVTHMTSKGAYVLVTLFADPTMKPDSSDPESEWPNVLGDSNARYAILAEAFWQDPRVLFGLTNEPHGPADRNAELVAKYQSAIDAIRKVEDAHGGKHHIVVVQAPQVFARDVSYFVEHPLPGDQIAYEVHPYNAQKDFEALLVRPGKKLPILVGEYGPTGAMTTNDIQALWAVCKANEIPHIAWNFHLRCPPNMLQDKAADGCGLDASTKYDFPRTEWGEALKTYLSAPW